MSSRLAGRRILITGAARGIGAATARRLHARGARVVLAGIEPDLLARTAAACGDALAVVCDVRDRDQVEAAVEAAVEHMDGLDVVVANAGVAAQLPLVGGDPEVFERTIEVNLLGVYYTLRAAGPHIAHQTGYALAISSLAAALHPPLLGAYCASKAGVEALADSLRIELYPSGARVGIAYFAELDTDMVRRGLGTAAARRMSEVRPRGGSVAPVDAGVDAIERGIARRARRVVAPRWVGAALPVRMLAQRGIEAATRSSIQSVLEIALGENAPLSTPQPVVSRDTALTSPKPGPAPGARARGPRRCGSAGRCRRAVDADRSLRAGRTSRADHTSTPARAAGQSDRAPWAGGRSWGARSCSRVLRRSLLARRTRSGHGEEEDAEHDHADQQGSPTSDGCVPGLQGMEAFDDY